MNDRRRTKHVEPVEAAIARVLRDVGTMPSMTIDTIDEVALREWRERQHVPAMPDPVDRAERRARMVELGWPTRAIEHAERADRTDAIAAVESWRNGHHSAIILAGGKGVGKTVAAAWFALTTPLRATMRFIRAATLLRTSNFADGFGEIMDAPALCLDDLGAEYMDAKGWFASNLDELVDTSYGARRPLIITTNADAKTLSERYGARVIDRITECATWSGIGGESLRENEPATTTPPNNRFAMLEMDPPPWERPRKMLDAGPRCEEKGQCEDIDGSGACFGCGRWLGDK